MSAEVRADWLGTNLAATNLNSAFVQGTYALPTPSLVDSRSADNATALSALDVGGVFDPPGSAGFAGPTAWTFQGSSRADASAAGQIGVFTSIEYAASSNGGSMITNNAGSNNSASAVSTFTHSGLVVDYTGPGPAPTTVDFLIRLQLHIPEVTAAVDVPAGRGDVSSLLINNEVSANIRGNGVALLGNLSGGDGTSFRLSKSFGIGALNGGDFFAITTGTEWTQISAQVFELNAHARTAVGNPFALTTTLSATTGFRSFARGNFEFGARGTTDASSTFGYLVSGATFALPEGFTINSADNLIVDGVFQPTPVPLPAALWMFSAGATMLIARRRLAPGAEAS